MCISNNDEKVVYPSSAHLSLHSPAGTAWIFCYNFYPPHYAAGPGFEPTPVSGRVAPLKDALPIELQRRSLGWVKILNVDHSV